MLKVSILHYLGCAKWLYWAKARGWRTAADYHHKSAERPQDHFLKARDFHYVFSHVPICVHRGSHSGPVEGRYRVAPGNVALTWAHPQNAPDGHFWKSETFDDGQMGTADFPISCLSSYREAGVL